MMKKRILGIVLSVCMLASAVSINPISSSAAGETNVAYGKQAYASSDLSAWGAGASALTDGITDAWQSEFSSDASSDEVSQWAAVDLGAAYVVDSVVLCTKNDQGLPSEFSIMVYNGEKWIEVYHGYAPEDDSDMAKGNRFDFDAITCNAVKVIASRPSYRTSENKYVFRLSELEVYGVASDAVLDTPSFTDTTTNVALTSEISISDASRDDWAEGYSENNGYKLYASERAIDGQTSYNSGKGYWYGSRSADKQLTPITATLKFENTYRINKISLEPAYSWSAYEGGFPEDFILEVFTKEGWKTVVSRKGFIPNTNGTTKTFYFPDVDCTAVKLTTSKNGAIGDNYGINLGEFAVYGVESDATIDQLPTNFSAIQTNGTPFASTSSELGQINLNELNDGSTSEYWSYSFISKGFSNPMSGQYAGVVLNQAYWINSVTISTYGKTLPEDFHISIYNGVEWIEVVRESGYIPTTEDYGDFVFTFDEICGNAIKFTADKMKKIVIGGDTAYAMRIVELVINGAPSSNTIVKPTTELFNISSGMEVTAGSITDWYGELSYLTDNNRNTFYFSNWSPSADNCEWVQITFDAPMKAHYIDVYPWAESDIPKRFPKDFEIQVYTDAGWKTVLSMTDFEITQEQYAGASVTGINPNAPFRFGFAPIECSAIRLVATELDTTNAAYKGVAFGLLIADMNVYGDNANSVVEKPSNPKRGHQAPAAVVLSKGTNNEMLNDADRTSADNNYTSELVESADGTVSMQFVFERPTSIDRIQFFPTDNGKFPTSFKVYAYTAEGWKLIKDAKDYTTYITGGFKLFSFKEVCCSSIMIQMTGLSELNGKYGVQLKDIDITGSIATDTGVVLADGDGNNKLTTADLSYVREELLKEEQSGKYDFNMDTAVDVRDLVRTKVYFANKK